MIHTPIQGILNEGIGREQGGFHKHNSTEDYIFIITHLTWRSPLSLLFIDYKKAFYLVE